MLLVARESNRGACGIRVPTNVAEGLDGHLKQLGAKAIATLQTVFPLDLDANAGFLIELSRV
jgi:hypothetical protein